MGSTSFDPRRFLREEEVCIVHAQADLISPLPEKSVPQWLESGQKERT